DLLSALREYVLVLRGRCTVRALRPASTLLPYTTLFRSLRRVIAGTPREAIGARAMLDEYVARRRRDRWAGLAFTHGLVHLFGTRSEEHTSELQSRENLVCRLLVEKKKLG